MATTYEPLATITLGATTNQIDFTSISSAYTDLRVIATIIGGNAGDLYLRFNGVSTGNLYSNYNLYGNGGSVTASGQVNQNQIFCNSQWSILNQPQLFKIDIQQYKSAIPKSCLITQSTNPGNGNGVVTRKVGLQNSISAITSINLINSTDLFAVGSTFTLYGIKAA